MKIKNMLMLLFVAVIFASCATTTATMPFAPKYKTGRLPVKKNKPVKEQASWTCRQWGHSGR